MTLKDFLKGKGEGLGQVVLALAGASSEISKKIRTAQVGKSGTQNQFGEDQLALDLLADQTLLSFLKKSGKVASFASEEQDSILELSKEGEFSVLADPLDGSSLVDVNLSVGLIFGILPGSEILKRKGEEFEAAGFAIFGPRTTFVLALKNEKVLEFTLQEDESWLLSNSEIELSGKKKIFAPGNLRAVQDFPEFEKLVQTWAQDGFTLRYSGGMVPDVNHFLLKGGGIFAYPGSPKHPAKLRLLFEGAPLAFVIEAAGGASSSGSRSLLKEPFEELTQRIPVFLGDKVEVERAISFLQK